MPKILTPDQADRAIYFDFEGCKNEAPSLLGWSYLTDDRKTEYVCQSVVEPLLWPAAGAKIPHTAGNCRCDRKSFDEAARFLFDTAHGEDRLLVSWSTHDLTMIEKHFTDEHLAFQIGSRYRNALPTAHQWLKKIHSGIELPGGFGGGHTLAAYAQIMNLHIPVKYGTNVAAHGIRTMRDVFESARTYTTLMKTERDAWKALLGHNRLDCKYAREIVTRAAREYSCS
jgi:hypothetical protein